MNDEWIGSFESFASCIPESKLDSFLDDCVKCFNCTKVGDDSNYSEGQTYFQPCDAKPSNELEAYALSIFQHHTQHLKGFNRKNSGSEWWTQVIDSEDDIGFHWDRDYGEEEENGNHIYPDFGTVTYLTSLGGATVIMNIEGTKNSSDPITSTSTDILTSNPIVPSMIISSPVIGKHVKFKGNLLHAAPSDTLMNRTEDDVVSIDGDSNSDSDSDSENDDKNNNNEEDDNNNDSDSKDDSSSCSLSKKRITFLVNVWLNHKPSQSVRFPAKLNAKLMLSSADVDTKLLFNEPTTSDDLINIHLSSNNTRNNSNNDNDNDNDNKNSIVNSIIHRRWKFMEGDNTLIITVPLYSNIQTMLESSKNGHTSSSSTQQQQQQQRKKKKFDKTQSPSLSSNVLVTYDGYDNVRLSLQTAQDYFSQQIK